MSGVSRKGPIVDPGKCRCCGALKKCRILNVEYEWMGQTEIYSEMFVDCFGLMLSHLEGDESERVVCATCVVRLRDACAFRRQVLQCEEKLLKSAVKIYEDVEEDRLKVEVKQEVDILSDRPDDNNTPDQLSDGEDGDDVDNRSNGDEDMCDNVEEKQIHINVGQVRSMQAGKRPPPTDRGKVIMLTKLKKLSQELEQIKYDPPIEYRPQKPKKPIDKDYNTFKNAITIVQNSYVCPFTAVFSDYHCVYCKEMILDPTLLREHTLKHDPAKYKDVADIKRLNQIDIERIDCRLCDVTIDNIDFLKQHLTDVHGKTFFTDINREFMKFKLKIGTVNCMECGKSFGYFHALKKHMAEHYGSFICDICGAYFFEERHLYLHKQKSHERNKKDSVFPCDQCSKTFKSKYSRNFHVSRIHKNEPAYPCNKCDEIFMSYHMRYRHKMDVHGEKRSFPCELCNKVYHTRKLLTEHTHRTHLQLFRHECTLCDKKFYLPSALRDHMTSHTGERNFRCEYCGKNYPRSKALKVHIQSHSSEKKYKCSLCPSAYTQVTNFKNHMKSKHPEAEGYR